MNANNILSRKGIVVYCGSSAGNNPAFAEAAQEVGRQIAGRQLPLIYGGGHMGMMGAVGRAVRQAGGQTVAVIPQFMVERGWNDPDSSETVVTPSMHVRKQTMVANAVGAIALPGGIGTWEELCELITWRQLGLYSGNIVLLNLLGYYDGLLAQFNQAVETGFYPSTHLALFEVTDSPAKAVELAARNASPTPVPPKF